MHLNKVRAPAADPMPNMLCRAALFDMLNVLPTCFEEVTGKSQTRPQTNTTNSRKRPGQAPVRPRKQVGSGVWAYAACAAEAESVTGRPSHPRKLPPWQMLHVVKQRRGAQSRPPAGPAGRWLITSGRWTCAA